MGGFYHYDCEFDVSSSPANRDYDDGFGHTDNFSIHHPCGYAASSNAPQKPPLEVYRYNPYDTHCVREFLYRGDVYDGRYDEEEQEQEEPVVPLLPQGTLHLELVGHVPFVPYPTEEFHAPPPSVPKEKMVRVFLGQLPYQVTDMQLDWLCYTFGAGATVYFPERITKHDSSRGCKVPTGCIHGYCDSESAAALLASLHKKVLVDDTGVWFAEDHAQEAVLSRYCQSMKIDRARRFQNRPYDTIVAQYATSNYVPSKRRR